MGNRGRGGPEKAAADKAKADKAKSFSAKEKRKRDLGESAPWSRFFVFVMLLFFFVPRSQLTYFALYLNLVKEEAKEM